MGYANCIPAWMLEEIIKEQAARKKKWGDMGLKLTARIITGSAEYFKELNLQQMRTGINKICCETLNQLDSEQYILSRGFAVD